MLAVACAAAGSLSMPTRQYPHALTAVSHKWRDLAERRRAHFVDLYESGRWRRYYNEARFVTEFNDAITAAERWVKLAPRPEDEAEPPQIPDGPQALRKAS
jgi:uncharacterized repeat protein (TIGR03809 family)